MKKEIHVLITEEEIRARVKELGAQISKDYEGKEIFMVCVLRGGVFFSCELAKNITVPLEIDFMAASSYGSKTVSSGNVKILKDLDTDIKGKHILIAEDIVDTGNTIKALIEMLWKREPADIKVCTMLDKPSRREQKMIKTDYNGFEIPDAFVIGMGLDYDQKYRNLPYIGVVEFKED